MNTFVPDASVILKWVIGEEDSKNTQTLLDGWLNQEYEFILPSLWVYEVGNVLGLKRPKEADAILSLLIDYAFQECEMTKDLIAATFGLMKAYRGITFYDAVYHAVALQEKGVMITADRAYYEKTKKQGSVRLI